MSEYDKNSMDVFILNTVGRLEALEKVLKLEVEKGDIQQEQIRRLQEKIKELEKWKQSMPSLYNMENKMKDVQGKLNDFIMVGKGLEQKFEFIGEIVDGQRDRIKELKSVLRDFIKGFLKGEITIPQMENMIERLDSEDPFDPSIGQNIALLANELEKIKPKEQEPDVDIPIPEDDRIATVETICPKCGFQVNHLFKYGYYLVDKFLADLDNLKKVDYSGKMGIPIGEIRELRKKVEAMKE